MPFDAMRLRRAGAVAYPLALTVANPGAETGDETGWTQNYGDVSGTGFGVSNTNTASLGFVGAYYFVLSISQDAYVEVNQAIDLPGAAHADIDAGTLALTLSALVNGANSDTDWGTFRVEFWSGAGGTGTFLGQRSTAQIDRNASVATETNTWTVPRLSRSIVLFVYGRRITGTELSFYWDEVAVSLASSGNTVESLFVDRGSDTSGWTITIGSGQPTTNTTWSNWVGWPGLTPGSIAAWKGHKDIDVSSLTAAAQAAIAAGTATLFLNRYAWNENDDDQSRTWIECYNGGSVVATVQDVASPAAHVTGSTVHLFNSGSVAVPSTTTKFRLNLHFNRVDGTVLDAVVGFLDSYIRW